jgi:2-methylcitrate dehydratase PrpD
MALARELAERIVNTRREDLPPEAAYWGQVAVLDTLGCTLAGANEDAPVMLREVTELNGRGGPCLIVGTRERAGCLDAAQINGVAAHALDFDNTAYHMGGHVSAVMVPALIAAAEAHDLGGADVLAAHAVGFETGARLGHGVNFHHSEKGWHPTATLGVFAVTAACAHLLKLSVAQTETALALATSLAAGIKANFGTMTKPLHAGQCARGGLMAALLARKGFTANPEAFEHKQGFLKLFNGDGNYDIDAVMAGWGKPFEIVSPGAGYKQYPCCYSTHAAVQAALDLTRRHGVYDPARIAKVASFTSARGLAHTDRPDPDSTLNAKFSVQYCVARALIDGKIVMEHFEGDSYRDARVRGLLPRVHAAPYTPAQFTDDFPFGAEVTVTLTGGGTHTARVERPLGRASDNPIPPVEMRAKFEDCAGRVLSPRAASAAADGIESLGQLKSIRALTALLEPQSAGDARAARSAA